MKVEKVEKNQSQEKNEEIMRILANIVIDCILADYKNNRLKFILEKPNIDLERRNNHGTNQRF